MYLHQTKLRMQAFEKLTGDQLKEQENHALFNYSVVLVGFAIIVWQSLI
ncbi:hypothetical protein R4Z09_13405 [Niallia oryzisoli]|uniref:Uncharacterized protein n=1 Tax=Niallia oryzisoli TaxID=1737571 RepID=A0ABZ2CJB7_9BACI